MEINIKITLADLTKEDITNAIKNEAKNALTRLIISKYEESKDKGVQVKDYYYASHIACSSEDFDMFSAGGLKSLFNSYGYETELSLTSRNKYGLYYGKFIVKKDGFCFTMYAEEGMHDSLYDVFVDAKTAVITG